MSTTISLLLTAPINWLFRVPFLGIPEKTLYLSASEVVHELDAYRLGKTTLLQKEKDLLDEC
jgi:hypothetical protein